MVDLQVVGSAADHAHAVAPVNLVADASPFRPERILCRPRQSRTCTQSAWQVSSGLCSTHVRGRKTSPAGCSGAPDVGGEFLWVVSLLGEPAGRFPLASCFGSPFVAVGPQRLSSGQAARR